MDKKTTKKKNIIFKKIKKRFLKILYAILDFFENLFIKFKSLKKHVRYIIYVWSLVFIIIVALIVLSFKNTKFKEDYVEMEKQLNEAALKYTEKNGLYPPRANKLKLQLDMLEDFGYVDSSVIKDDSCIGYARVYYDSDKDTYSSDSYLNCKKYTTKGYFDNK